MGEAEQSAAGGFPDQRRSFQSSNFMFQIHHRILSCTATSQKKAKLFELNARLKIMIISP